MYYRTAMILVLLCYSLLGLTAVSAEGTGVLTGDPVKLKYDFNEIKVIYAAEFLAYPDNPAPTKPATVVSAVYKATVGSAVYGEMEPIHVLYGVVTLGSEGGMKEDFIRVSQGNEFTRGLSNGGSWDGFKDPYNVFTTEFLTGKTLEGKSVVKDYSAGWKTIKMTRTVDKNGDMKDISIRFDWNLAGVPDPFFEKLLGKVYKVDIVSLKDVGKQEVGP